MRITLCVVCLLFSYFTSFGSPHSQNAFAGDNKYQLRQNLRVLEHQYSLKQEQYKELKRNFAKTSCGEEDSSGLKMSQINIDVTVESSFQNRQRNLQQQEARRLDKELHALRRELVFHRKLLAEQQRHSKGEVNTYKTQ